MKFDFDPETMALVFFAAAMFSIALIVGAIGMAMNYGQVLLR